MTGLGMIGCLVDSLRSWVNRHARGPQSDWEDRMGSIGLHIVGVTYMGLLVVVVRQTTLARTRMRNKKTVAPPAEPLTTS